MRIVIKMVSALLVGWAVIAPAYAQQAMTFFMETDQTKRWAAKMSGDGLEDIYASGDITEGTADRFLAFIRQNGVEGAKVHFNSLGGSLLEGMKMGRAIRTMEFSTTVGVYNCRRLPT